MSRSLQARSKSAMNSLPAVDLYGPDLERRLLDQAVEEALGGGGGGSAGGHALAPSRAAVYGGELLDGVVAGKPDRESVDLYCIARSAGLEGSSEAF